ncbi:hypothetical protein H0H81_004498 [Sphagnurus paluster]|uniref:Uncharacterized protein n=1 Tax=Sphagnurus paluster TaxID=117069 RepID=A0A9P7K5Q0_9AGAR|nr:hypothetical protein H0H81_004498 [Sphagnurus paluster]
MAESSAPAEIFESLPYYDDDLQKYPELKLKVEQELARQPKPPTTLHPRVPPPYELFAKNPLLRAELERIESHQEFPSLDTLRYQLPAPTSTPGTDEEWKAALRNAEAQLEHQRIRQTNLTLLQTYGPNAWRIHNYLLEATAKQTEKALEDLKQLTVDVNRERKNHQDRLGKQLTSLETRWTELISIHPREDEKLRQASRDASMANTDKETTVSLQSPGKEGQAPAQGVSSGVGEELWDTKGPGDGVKTAVTPSEVGKTTPASSDLKHTTTRPSLVQLGSSSTHPTTPQPKRYSAVNINKKFLEKNSTAAASSPISQPAVKAGGPALVRPQTQSLTSHSRLVTAKLTSISPASSASGAGWSRPSSAAPPNTGAHSPNNNSPTLPATSLATSSTTDAPQLPHASKVIQPQPRAPQAASGLSQKDTTSSHKPVWGNIRSTSTPKLPDVRNEFPTAAEVAQVASSLRTTKLNDSREAAETAAATKQARMEEADTFRGVHLDPNAHHWDEMEEDDDNFLDGVIEFGDGRQYKIETTEIASADSSITATDPNSSAEPHHGESRLDNIITSKDSVPSIPVNKEERFADDFDRSWPRSRNSPAVSRDVPLPSSHSGPSHMSPSSSASAHEMHSQQEASRVLFNERSNRLEPYSNGSRSGPGQYASKRGSWQEPSSASTEPRSARDFSSSSHSQGVQLLQKPGGHGEHQGSFRRFSGTSYNGGFGSGLSGAYHRDQSSRRDGPTSPRMMKDNLNLPGRDREVSDRGRRSDMGPPPLPMHSTRRPSKDGGRQLPPHLSQLPGSVPTGQGRRTSGDSRSGDSSVPHSARLPSQSPVLSQTSAAWLSPATPLTPLPNLSAPELDEVRKDVMQSAAARAKARRQQEEEEREKEKERARRKAAELEERIKAVEAEKAKAQEALDSERLAKRKQEEEAVAVIEEAVKSVQLPPDSLDLRSGPRHPLRRPPSLKGLPTSEPVKPTVPQRQSSGTAPTIIPTPAVQAESWRSKANPLPPPPTSPARTTSFAPPPRVLNVEQLADGTDEDLEVVDFLDMGKFVGVPEEALESIKGEERESTSQPPTSRPVASDFFDEPPSVPGPPSSATPEGLWRQKSSQETTRTPEKSAEAKTSTKKDLPRTVVTEDASRPSDLPLSSPPKSSSISLEQHGQPQVALVPRHPSTVRTPRNQTFYKEAKMSALDDAMSRIKGALAQAGEAAKEAPTPLVISDSDLSTSKNAPPTPGRLSSQRERWVPPALRPRNFDFEAHEVFNVTCGETPRSPKPAWNNFVVRLPTSSESLEPISKRQLQSAITSPSQVRFDILSFDPPVEGMNRRDLSVNEILFRSVGLRGKPRYRVMLPKFRVGPRVSLPAHPLPPKSSAPFARITAADGASTWRKPPQPKSESEVPTNPEPALSTTSRSPPPETPAPGDTSVSASEPSTSKKSDGDTSARSRVLKMPAGSAVAFYRDSRVDAVEEDPKPSVNFIVGSELERQVPSPTTSEPRPNITITSPTLPTPSLDPPGKIDTPLEAKSSSTTELTPSLVLNKAESKSSSDDSSDRTPITPPTHHTTSWARTSLSIPLKESPARGPDPEHLKAVWSQTSNKAGSHGVNSLEGIADDLTALPFTLQDVKSEDGETPPPSISAPPSRMSLHEVTRAFQQVPQSSSSNPSPSHRTPPLSAPPTRTPNYAYGMPPPPTGPLRPGYSYPAPMMGHNHNPGHMYPQMMPGSPAPGRMPVNGHAPLYSQPMWMPIPAPNPQNHANMMRTMGSPYPAPLMSYSPVPSPMYGHPPANMQSHSQQQNGVQNRDRSNMISPVMAHAAASMYGSPVLMHASPMPIAANHSYMVPAGRGQTRTDNGQVPQQHHPHQPHSAYNPHSSFVRSNW